MTPIIEESYWDTVRRLSAFQKAAAPGAPAYSILVNRRLGRLFAALAYRAGLSPNNVTLISATFTFAAIATIALVRPNFIVGVLVWLLLALGYALDSADGQVARLTGGGSPAGEWLDHVIDALKAVSLHSAVLICIYRFFPVDRVWLLVPIAFSIVASGLFFAMILNDQLRAVHAARRGTTHQLRTGSTLFRSILLAPTDYGVLCLVFVTLGAPVVFLAIYTFLFAANAGYFALAARKWFGDMTALGAAVPADVEDR